MATSKAVYTPEQSEELKNLWNDGKGKTVQELSEKFGKSAASIIQKLVRLGVYKAKPKLTKTGEIVTKKSEQAEMIGKMLRLPTSDIDSLEKANKTALKAISYALAYSIPLESLTPIQESTRNKYADIIGAFLGFGVNVSSSLRVLSFDTLQQAVNNLYEKGLIPDFNLEASDEEQKDYELYDDDDDDDDNEESDDEKTV